MTVENAPSWLEDLNPQQQEAVTAELGPVLVLAGPGSGKTRVLTYRAAYLIYELGVPPFHILAVTFTNKAANEMRERIAELLGGTPRGLTVGTFHSICARFLRRDGDVIGIPSNFVIYDDNDQIGVIKAVLKELDLDEKLYPPRRISNFISRAKNELLTPDMVRARIHREEIFRRVYERYQEKLREAHALDFDDLIMEVVRLFREHDDVLEKYQRRYQHVLVDEFQDTNTAQYEFVKILGKSHRQVFVVGDEDQSIYRFRGADFRNVLRFRKDFPEAKLVLLEQNYRSTGHILAAANAIISKNSSRTPKQLFTQRGEGTKIRLREAYDETEEADFVANEIIRLTGEGYRFGDIAVMYRTNAQSRALEEAFLRHEIPYQLVGATRFYARREVKDVLAYLRLIHNPSDDISFLRIVNVPARGIGAKTVGVLQRWARDAGLAILPALRLVAAGSDSIEPPPLRRRAMDAVLSFARTIEELREESDGMPVPELITALLEKVKYKDYILKDDSEESKERWNNVLELVNVASTILVGPDEDPLTAFLERVSLVSDVDNLRESENGVTLLTLHAAKGLEFPVVFIVGLEDGLLPHSRSIDEPDEMEEERRLFYVGITRAKDLLYLLHTFRRTRYGSSDLSMPSRFLSEIPKDVVENYSPGSYGRGGPGARRSSKSWPFEPLGGSKRSSGGPIPRFYAGQRVRHPKFGVGTVVSVVEKNGDQEVRVAFAGKGIKLFLAKLANLEAV